MALSSQELAFMQRLQSTAHNLGDIIADLRQLEGIYFDRTYSALVDADLADVEATADQLADAINLIAQIKNLMDNNAVTQGDWDANLNAIRRL